MHNDNRRLSIRESRAVRVGVTIATIAALSLIALIAVGTVKGPDSDNPPMPANAQQYASQQRERPLTSLDFIRSANEQRQADPDDYPRNNGGLVLPPQGHR